METEWWGFYFKGGWARKGPEGRGHLSRDMVKGRKQNHLKRVGRAVLAMGTVKRGPLRAPVCSAGLGN